MHKRPRDRFPQTRPVEKGIRYVNHLVSSTGVAHTPLFRATYPCTIENLRWNFAFYHESIVAQVQIAGWAIVVVRSAEQNGDLSFTNNSNYYTLANANVMAHGIVGTCFETNPELAAQMPTIVNKEGKSLTARKFQKDDTLVWIGKSTNVAACNIQGVIQFIIKS